MPIAKRNLRGLRELRTLPGRVNEAVMPHRAHMKLACLEMEKARRRIERNSVVDRLREIDSRIRDIDAEEAAIRRTMGSEADGPGGASPVSRSEPGNPRNRKRLFKVKY